jgi:hypothetical protein
LRVERGGSWEVGASRNPEWKDRVHSVGLSLEGIGAEGGGVVGNVQILDSLQVSEHKGRRETDRIHFPNSYCFTITKIDLTEKQPCLSVIGILRQGLIQYKGGLNSILGLQIGARQLYLARAIWKTRLVVRIQAVKPLFGVVEIFFLREDAPNTGIASSWVGAYSRIASASFRTFANSPAYRKTRVRFLLASIFSGTIFLAASKNGAA